MSEAPDLYKGIIRPRKFQVVARAVALLCRVLFGLKSTGRENVPMDQPFILVGNHLHNLDPVFMLVSSPRLIFFMAKQELFEVPVVKQIISWVGAFPIHRGKMDRSAIRKGQEILKAGAPMGIYPEGTRSLSRHLEKALPGAGLFATGGEYLIVPCAITGSETLPFNGAKGRGNLPKRNPGHKGVLVRYGEPFRLPDEIDGKRPNAAAATDYMMRKVAELLPDEYRGVYGDPPAL